MAYQNFYDLEAWKAARRFKRQLFEIIKAFPTSERYELTSQLSRSARSVLANIAEGHGRHTAKDELHFAIMARGSLSEVLNHLIDARDSGYIDDVHLKKLKHDWDHVRRILNGYVSFLRSKTIPPRDGSYVAEADTIDILEISDEAIDADHDFIHKLSDSLRDEQ